jgi:hypothetical protein
MEYILLIALVLASSCHSYTACDINTLNGCDLITLTVKDNDIRPCNKTTPPIIGACNISEPNQCLKYIDRGLSCTNITAVGIQLIYTGVDCGTLFRGRSIITAKTLLPVYPDKLGYWNPFPGTIPLSCSHSFQCFKMICELLTVRKVPMVLMAAQ